MLTQDDLKSQLEYDPNTGIFRWRISGKGKPAHGIAGTPNQRGQILICIQYKRYLAHRLAWLYMTGIWPSEIDHVDGNPGNNRFQNLREATHSQNLANTKVRVDNTSGHKGVTWDKQKMKWKVQVGPAGKRLQKHFLLKHDAVAWYNEQVVAIYGDFARPSVGALKTY